MRINPGERLIAKLTEEGIILRPVAYRGALRGDD
jgi:hypothetical protein